MNTDGLWINHRRHIGALLDNFHLKGEAAEVGVAEGHFSGTLASCAEITKLYMVDNWATIGGQKGDGGFEQSWHDKNFELASYMAQNPKCHIMRGMSTEMAKQIPDESLILVYLDADHSYEGIKADLQAWWPKVKIGGIIAGHDYLATEYGVKQAVDELGLTVYLIPEDQECDASFWIIK